GAGTAGSGDCHAAGPERPDAPRVEGQLIARCGRQGAPGWSRQYLSLDDDTILFGLGPKHATRLAERGRQSAGPFDELAPLFRKSQRRIERRHFRDRKSLMYHEKERKKVLLQMGQDPYLDSPA